MGDQSETPNKRPSKSDGISMAELAEALPNSGSGHSTQYYPVPSTHIQYQPSPPAYSFQQPYVAPNSPSSYSGAIDMSQYYSIQPGQQPIESAQGGYQYGGHVGYRNPGTNIALLPQFPAPIPRSMQQPLQGQSYPVPRYPYGQASQPYQQNYGRGVPFNPSYSTYPTSPPSRTPAQFSHQSPYSVFPPPFQNAGSIYSDGYVPPADLENMLPRGPPRKPKQSGFALWVGNLPRDVKLEEMKDFFASSGLESIFLIRKSNSAFVNYRTEDDCAAALAMFNDKMFQNVRLVCRLRKSSPVRPPQNIAASEAVAKPDDSSWPQQPTETPPITETTKAQDVDNSESPSTARNPTPFKDRYFILKSLTKEDLAWSVSNKVWATQPHNETVLNEAFKSSQNVYLIFSVNKSGEFFGYARMASEINTTQENEKVKIGDKNESYDTAESPPVLLSGPKTTVTPRTNTAPRGKIFEDEVRGTVFWEIADSSEDDEADDQGDQSAQLKGETRWGNPFKVEWIKWDASLQFQRTRALRNPWNGNREIKISRDGTEIEPTVGARLLKEFDNTVSFNPGFVGSNENIRRMSYPTAIRPNIASPHMMYQPTTPIPSQGWQYVPFSSSPSQPVYNYSQTRPPPQSPPSQHPYPQQPR